MVRVWRPGGGERLDGVRGMAVHLTSGRQITFSDPQRLIAFLAEAGARDPGPAAMRTDLPTPDEE